MIDKKITINGINYNISAKVYLPDDSEINEMIIACHGFAGDKESSAILLVAEEMTKHKVGVICFDFPGHGESEVDANELTIENCIKDIDEVENYIKKEYSNIDISIFATSFGAYISLINILKNNKNYKNIILRAPAINMAGIYKDNLLREDIEEYKQRGYTKLGFEREMNVPFSFLEELESNNIFELINNSEIPEIYIIQGDKDDIAPISDTKRFKELNSKKINLFIIPGADHRMKGDGELDKVVNYTKKIILKEGE